MGGGLGQLAQLLHRADQRIYFHWAPGIQILPHRGAMRANSGPAIDTPIDIDGKFHAQLFGNLLGLNHHAARHRTGAGIGAEHIQRGVGER